VFLHIYYRIAGHDFLLAHHPKLKEAYPIRKSILSLFFACDNTPP
jgi:hypothetical protein